MATLREWRAQADWVGLMYVFAAAATLAAYTVWDKLAITNIAPFQYFYSYTAVIAGFLAVVQRRIVSSAGVRSLLKVEWALVLIVAVANAAGYIMVLYALQPSDASLVGGSSTESGRWRCTWRSVAEGTMVLL